MRSVSEKNLVSDPQHCLPVPCHYESVAVYGIYFRSEALSLCDHQFFSRHEPFFYRQSSSVTLRRCMSKFPSLTLEFAPSALIFRNLRHVQQKNLNSLLQEGRKVHFAASHDESDGKKAKHPR
jgi:hypothetical protein